MNGKRVSNALWRRYSLQMMLLFLRFIQGKICARHRIFMILGCLTVMVVPVAGCDSSGPGGTTAQPTQSGTPTVDTTNSAVPTPEGSSAATPPGPDVPGPATPPTTAALPTPPLSGPEPAAPVSGPQAVSSSSANDDSVSGQRLPVGDLPGWRQVFASDFTHGDVPVGGFPGAMYGAAWSAGYGDGTPDTAGQGSGGKSGYYPSKVLSVKNGVLDWYLHSESGISMGAAPAPIIANSSQSPHRPNSQLYGRYSVRFKADALPGFKAAWLMWPDSGLWPMDGELDYPEGDLAGPLSGAVHRSGLSQDVYDVVPSDALFTSWHTATTEWTPGRVSFLLDGKLLGASTVGTPVKPMHYILQTESCLPGCPLPTTAGHVQVAWVAIWSRI